MSTRMVQIRCLCGGHDAMSRSFLELTVCVVYARYFTVHVRKRVILRGIFRFIFRKEKSKSKTDSFFLSLQGLTPVFVHIDVKS